MNEKIGLDVTGIIKTKLIAFWIGQRLVKS
jgi:hypothetical protein